LPTKDFNALQRLLNAFQAEHDRKYVYRLNFCHQRLGEADLLQKPEQTKWSRMS